MTIVPEQVQHTDSACTDLQAYTPTEPPHPPGQYYATNCNYVWHDSLDYQNVNNSYCYVDSNVQLVQAATMTDSGYPSDHVDALIMPTNEPTTPTLIAPDLIRPTPSLDQYLSISMLNDKDSQIDDSDLFDFITTTTTTANHHSGMDDGSSEHCEFIDPQCSLGSTYYSNASYSLLDGMVENSCGGHGGGSYDSSPTNHMHHHYCHDGVPMDGKFVEGEGEEFAASAYIVTTMESNNKMTEQLPDNHEASVKSSPSSSSLKARKTSKKVTNKKSSTSKKTRALVEPRIWYKCGWTGCSFGSFYNGVVKRHSCKKHSGQARIDKSSNSSMQRFKCDWPGCEVSLVAYHKLVEHKRKHTGEKPFRCKWKACNYATARLYSMIIHERTHKLEALAAAAKAKARPD